MKFSTKDILAISEVFGDPNDGIPMSELRSVFETCRIRFSNPATNQAETIFQALSEQQAMDGHRRSILAFLRTSMDHTRWSEDPERYQRLRVQLNEQLLLCGLQIEEDGKLSKTEDSDKELFGLLRFILKLIFRFD